VFTLEQVAQLSQALKGGAPSVISVFAGRIADTGLNPVPLMQAAGALCRAADANIELLWASPRELRNLVEANEAGCDIITVQPEILKKLDSLGKPLLDFSLETVQMFKRDAEAAGYSL
jgi:transaldolase